jgi:hypothetical protein
MRSHYFIRNIDADSYFENFLIAAVSSILLIRFFLTITGNPSLGGENFHIAHMLWGGLIMSIAISILLSFLNGTTDHLSSILGGIGFGVFIDELGKFITRDNNYFFQPTIAIIYVIFIILFLISRLIPKYKAYTQKEYLINAIEILKDAVVDDLDKEEKKLARQYLRKADTDDPIVKTLQKLFNEIETIPSPTPSIITKIIRFFRKEYHRLMISRTFFIALFSIFVIQSLATIIFLFIIYYLSFARFVTLQLSFSEWGLLFSSIIAGITMILGLRHFRSNRLEAYQLFQSAVLINVFLTQFFLFYLYQFSALIGLLLNLSLYLSLKYVIQRTKEKE